MCLAADGEYTVSACMAIECARTCFFHRARLARKKKPRMRRGLIAGASADQASVSAQMLRAQAMAYSPSSAVADADRPPEPGTVSMVFCVAS